MNEIHKIMPVILDPENESRWLDPNVSVEEALTMLHPYENRLKMHPVSVAVNSPRNQGEKLTLPLEYAPH
jgi:putative SOS response-associated peptidase YedK